MAETKQHFHLAVIGGGPGGYVAAIRGAQLGMEVALVEKAEVGGVCLNWGCIPSKALLRSAELFSLFRRSAEFGIICDQVQIDYARAVERSRRIARRLERGVEYLLRKNRVTLLRGTGYLSQPHRITISGGEGEREITADRIILATGSRPMLFPGMSVDGKQILTSSEALVLPEVPKSIIIIGGGAVGVEFAYLFATFGAQVTLVEMLPHLLPFEDAEIASALEASFRKQGIQVRTRTRVQEVQTVGERVRVSLEGQEEVLEADKLLMAIGRTPNSAQLGLEEIGVEVDGRGFITVNERFETTVPGIYAIGDVINTPLLAHVAMAEGVAAVEGMAGVERGPIDYRKIPSCTYCQPQVASIGLSEEKAREEGYEIKVGKFPFQASGKALAVGETEGFVKVVVEAKYGEILGLHILGAEATEMIAEGGALSTLEATTAEVLMTVHAHPTLSEAILEASLSAEGQAIHL